MPFNEDQKYFKKLVKIIRETPNDIIPFVGAGLSIYGNLEQRLPQWNELIHILLSETIELGLLSKQKISEIEQLIKKSSLIEAADKIVHTLGEIHFKRIMQEEIFNIEDKPIPPAIFELCCITWSLIATTNIDQFIEKSWLKKQREFILEVFTSTDINGVLEAILGFNRGNTLLKTHGTIERPESWVLTRKHYDKKIGDPKYRRILEYLYNKNLFFIGYGLADDDFEPFLEELNSLFPYGRGNKLFALLDDSVKETNRIRKLIRDFGILPIWFRVDPLRKDQPDCGYNEVLECLKIIVREWIRVHKKPKMTFKAFPELDPFFRGRVQDINLLNAYIFIQEIKAVQIIGFGGDGKTSLIQKWIEENTENFIKSGFEKIFGCSFYKEDVGRFIEFAFSFFCKKKDVLSIQEKVKELQSILYNQKNIIILDGFEAIQTENGMIRNSYIKEIINHAISGKSTVVVTSRLKIPAGFKTIQLENLSIEDSISILRRWGVKGSKKELEFAVRYYIGTHALSVRIMAEFIKSQKINNLSLLSGLRFTKDIRDEADQLKTNKVSRILDFYKDHLSAEAFAFMKTFSVIRRDIPKKDLLILFQKDLGEFSVNNLLKKCNLATLISELKEKRFIISTDKNELTCHPTVRDYYYELLISNEAFPFHELLIDYYFQYVKKEPKKLEDFFPLFESCYHSAKANKWKSYHNMFKKLINRDKEYYLGYVLGAWEEFLGLARLNFRNEDIYMPPQYSPAYYYGVIALCLKRLGRSKEAIHFYFQAIKNFIKEDPSEVARQINNLLILCHSLGSFGIVSRLTFLNIAAIGHIKDNWQKLWQSECAYITFGKTCTRLGYLEKAREFFDQSEKVRTEDDYIENKFYDIQRIFYVDMLLCETNPNFEKSQVIVDELLELGIKEGWKDLISSVYRVKCSIERRKANKCKKKSEKLLLLNSALEFMKKSLLITKELFQPELEIEVSLEAMKLAIDYKELKLDIPDELLFNEFLLLDRILELIDRTDLWLYKSEVLGLKAKIEMLEGNENNAKDFLNKAIELASITGDKILITNEQYKISGQLKTFGIIVDSEQVKTIEFPDFHKVSQTFFSFNDIFSEIELIESEWK